MKIEKLEIEKFRKSAGIKKGKYTEALWMLFNKQEEIIDQLEKQKQLNKIFSERLGLDPDDDRSKPDEECGCGGRVTLEKVCEHCGIFYHPMGESKLKLQRLLEWVEGNFIVPQDDVTPICVSRIDLKAKIKELMDED